MAFYSTQYNTAHARFIQPYSLKHCYSFKKFQDDVQAKCKIRRSPTNSRAVVMANLNSVELVRYVFLAML